MAWRGAGWPMALFGVPFILIGLVLLVGAFWRTIAGVRVTSPKIYVSNAMPELGERIRVKCEIGFRTSVMLQDARVQLIFRESASYTQGTDRRTDTHEEIIDFFELPIGEMERGRHLVEQGDFTLPTDGMHSFNADNNKLEWLIIAKLGVREWPDLIEEYALYVEPHKVW
jgi:hypothetical protein